MNIRRFAARDMRTALKEIRSSLGADAVMLSSRKTPQGVEIIAAIDYDDRLLAAAGDEENSVPIGGELAVVEDSQASGDPRAAAEPPTYEQIVQRLQARLPEPQPAEPQPAERQPAERQSPPLEPPPAEPQPAESRPIERPAPEAGPPPNDVKDELKDLRRLLETQLASLAWNDLNRCRPARARCLRQLSKLGVDIKLARRLADQMPTAKNARESWRLSLQLFTGCLSLARRDLSQVGGVYALVGPTGVGKTTSIAKIAARFLLRHDVHDLGLVSTDSYRIGARDQLMTFARILGVPMHVADNARELRAVLDSLAKKKLVLIDTAGMSQRDLRLANQFRTLRVAGHRVHPVLTMSAAADRGSLAETLAAFQAVTPKALILTKLDEATSLGPVLSVAIRSALPVAYLCAGQRVPEDMHLAGPKRTWLMQKAAQLVRDHNAPPDEAELASAFGAVELAANG